MCMGHASQQWEHVLLLLLLQLLQKQPTHRATQGR
jgi:hypothetical protein